MKEATKIDLLKRLVATPSYTGYENGDLEVADLLNDFLQSYGVRSWVDRINERQCNVVARIGREGGEKILLNGHLDTVQVSGMTCNPFGEESNGYLYGRGTSDMKSGVAALACTTIALLDQDINADIWFVGVAEEENGDIGLKSFIDKYGKDFVFSVVAEPTRLVPIVCHKGIKWIQVTFKGRSAHGSIPEKGINAIDAAADFLARVNSQLKKSLSSRCHQILGASTISTGTITGGTSTNMVADRCVITLDRRYIPGEEDNSVLNEIRDIARSASRNGSEYEVEEMSQTSFLNHSPFELSRDSVLLKYAKDVLREFNLQENESGLSFWTEAAVMNAEGCDSLVIGPGDPSLAHAPDERIEYKEYLNAIKVFTGICKKLSERSYSSE